MISETYGFLKTQKTCDTLKLYLRMNVFNCFMKRRVVYIQEIEKAGIMITRYNLEIHEIVGGAWYF